MSDRQVSDELADAIISMVQECQVTDDDLHSLVDTWTPKRIDGIKSTIAKVIDLLMEEVEQDIVEVMRRETGWSYD